MKIAVLTPDRELFSGDISSVQVPGISGRFEILNGHAPIVSALGEGKVTITPTSGDKIEYHIGKGFVEVLHNEVSLLIQAVTE